MLFFIISMYLDYKKACENAIFNGFSFWILNSEIWLGFFGGPGVNLIWIVIVIVSTEFEKYK